MEHDFTYTRAFDMPAGLKACADVLLEDNFFDMNAGERRVKVLRGTPTRVNAWSVYDIQ